MYFPRDISEIGDFLRSLKYNSNEENIRILDDILDRMRHMHGYTNKEVENLLFQYRMSLIRQDDNIDGEKLDKIGPVEQATISFGQGISVTPIQQVTAVSAVVT